MANMVGMYIKVRVNPGARDEMVTQLKDDTLAISVREPAERGMANKRVVELIRRFFTKELGQKAGEKKVGEIRLVSGHQSTMKIFSLEIK